jgi:hypothetical protein
VANTEQVDWGCRQGGIDCKDKRQFGQGDGDSGKIAQKMETLDRHLFTLDGSPWCSFF